MRIYIETTVWSFAFADDAPDLKADTLRFFAQCREGKHEVLIGPPVLTELMRAPEPRQSQLSSLVREIGPSSIPPNALADRLAEDFLRFGAVPPSKPDDASHVAYAFVAGADALVSWNFKHIANVRRSQKFNAVASLIGFVKPLIITSPSEVLYGDDQA